MTARATPAPYDWQAEDDLDLWHAELATNPHGLYLGTFETAVKMLAAETPRSYPKEVHD